MNVWNGIEDFPDRTRPFVAAIGNFDGVHLGHREILRRVREHAARRDADSLLVTFEPHPARVVAPERAPALLHTRRQKLDTLEECGLDDVLILRFDAGVAELGGEEFFSRLLAERIRFDAVFVGENFRFGRGREGDRHLLEHIGAHRGFTVHEVEPVLAADGTTISSSAIRRALAAGDAPAARRMLGRPFTVVGEVVRGEGRGRSLDCPTANVHVANETLPRTGVYVTEAVVLASRMPSVTNVGRRPTVGGDRVTVETHLLEFDDDLYGETIEVRFLEKLRDERRFDDLPALADQLARDRAAAEAFFQNRGLRTP